VRWIWLRHGETEANVLGCYLGHLDSPLTSKGYAQAAVAADRLSRERLELEREREGMLCELEQVSGDKSVHLYTSDLGRCMETASIVAEALGVKPEADSRLREIHFGDWEGKTYDEVSASGDKDLLREWYDDPFDRCPPAGETLWEMGLRIDEWIAEGIKKFGSDEVVIIVSHGGPIRWFQCQWLLGDLSAFWKSEKVPPGGIVAAMWDGKQFIADKKVGA